MKARWRAPLSASRRADGCSNASRQSRISFRTVTALALRLARHGLTGRNAPFIVASPCQSELKRTLRAPRGGREPRARHAGLHSPDAAFDANGESRVSKPASVWFRNRGCRAEHL